MPAQRGPDFSSLPLKSTLATPFSSASKPKTGADLSKPQATGPAAMPGAGAPVQPGAGVSPMVTAPSAKPPEGAQAAKSVGEYVRDNIENIILNNPADPGHKWEALANSTLSTINVQIGTWKENQAKKYLMDKALYESIKNVEYFANKAFDYNMTWTREQKQWLDAKHGTAWYPTTYEAVPDSYDGVAQLKYSILPDVSGFVETWSKCGKPMPWKAGSDRMVTALPDPAVLKNFPLTFDNKDAIADDGSIIPSVVRAFSEQPRALLDAINDAIVHLVQDGKFPKPVFNTDAGSTWEDGTPRIPTSIGTGSSYGEWNWSSGSPYGSGKVVNWAPYADALSGYDLHKIYYLGGYPGKAAGTLPTLAKVWSDYVQSLTRFFVAWANCVANTFNSDPYDPTGLSIGGKVLYPGKPNPKSMIPAYIAQYEKYMALAAQDRAADPVDALKASLQKDADAGKIDPALAKAAGIYVNIISDIRGITDNKEINDKDLQDSLDEAKKTTYDLGAIQKALDSAQTVADVELKKAGDNAQLTKARDNLWTYLKLAQDAGVTTIVEHIAKLQIPKEWVPNQKAKDYLSGQAFTTPPWPTELTAGGITGWGFYALKRLKELTTKPADWDQQFDLHEPLALAKKLANQYNTLLALLPSNYQATFTGNNALPQEVPEEEKNVGGGGDQGGIIATGLTITGVPDTIKIGDTVQLTAALLMADKSTGALTDPVNWKSSDDTIAAVDGVGRLIAYRNGVVTISASTPKYTTSKVITVGEKKKHHKPAGGPPWLLIGGAAAAAFLIVALTGKSKGE